MADPVGFGESVLRESFTEDVKRLMESVRDNPITVARSSNAVGKTHAAARIAVWFYKVFSDAQVYSAAAPPESNLKKLLWGEIVGLVERNPAIFEPDTVTTLHIARSAQSFITGVTIPVSGTEAQREAKFSGKHAPHILFILDEGDAIPDEVYRGIESCMTGGYARLLVMFNPRAEVGEVYRMERDRRANVVELSAFRHPNVITGLEIIPGAVTRDTTVRRINEWARPLNERERPDSECFELPDFLVETTTKSQAGYDYPELRPGYYKVMQPALDYMVLGRYPAQGTNQLINREWIARARARWDSYVVQNGEIPPVGVRPIMGLDVADMGNDSNVVCFRYGGWVPRLVDWSGVDPIVTGDRGAEEFKARNSLCAMVDGTGVGAGVAPHMQRLQCSAIKVMVASSPTFKTEEGEFKIMRDQLAWSAREWLRLDPGAMLPPDEPLIEELQTYTYEVKNGTIRVMDRDTVVELIKRSPDRSSALFLTFYPGSKFFPNGLRGVRRAQ
jgi:hypothetical protein